jgi:hypothetical protein
MRLSANLIRSYNTVNSFTFGDWTITANEANTLYFQLTDLDQIPWEMFNDVSWPGVIQQQSVIPNSLRYLTGIGSLNQPVIVTVQFPSLNCSSSPLTIVATPVSPNDSSLFMVSLTALQVPGTGNVIFTVQEGLNIRRFFVQSGITVINPLNLGSC